MAKIVLVEQEKISIGMEDGTIKEVRTSDLNFVPHVGDEVEVFEDNKALFMNAPSEEQNMFKIPKVIN